MPNCLSYNNELFNKFWCGLCEGIIGPEYLDILGDNKETVIQRTANFVLAQALSLPMFLKLALWIGIFVFNVYVFAFTGQPIYSLPIQKRKRIIETWANGKIAITRSLFRPLRSLTLLAFFEQPELLALLTQLNKDEQI
jgi:hypothetical protein